MSSEYTEVFHYNKYTSSLSKKKKSSKIWAEFKQLANEKGEVKAHYHYCKLCLVYGLNKGTSYLKHHLLEYCPKKPRGVHGEMRINNDEGEFIFDMKDLKKDTP